MLDLLSPNKSNKKYNEKTRLSLIVLFLLLLLPTHSLTNQNSEIFTHKTRMKGAEDRDFKRQENLNAINEAAPINRNEFDSEIHRRKKSAEEDDVYINVDQEKEAETTASNQSELSEYDDGDNIEPKNDTKDEESTGTRSGIVNGRVSTRLNHLTKLKKEPDFTYEGFPDQTPLHNRPCSTLFAYLNLNLNSKYFANMLCMYL